MSDYTIRFDFDCEGEAPRVYICGPSGSDDIEVIEPEYTPTTLFMAGVFRGSPLIVRDHL